MVSFSGSESDDEALGFLSLYHQDSENPGVCFISVYAIRQSTIDCAMLSFIQLQRHGGIAVTGRG